MAVCRTIRTKYSISNFIIPSENGDEYVTAFKCTDGKVEVHSLKKECAPLCLEENTTVNTISTDVSVLILLTVTPRLVSGCLEIRLWDVTSPLGFTPKDVCMKEENKKDGKIRCLFDVKSLMNDDISQHLCATFGSLIAFILNSKFCLLLRAVRNESNATVLNVLTSVQLNGLPVLDALFLNDKQKTYFCLAEGSNVNVMLLENDSLTSCNVIAVPMKKSKASFVASFRKLTCSKCLVADNMGHLSLLYAPNELTSLKFPTSVGGHNVNCVIGFKHTAEGILAICHSDYTINLYKLADILCSVSNSVSCYVKPYRVLCSQYPINSITFVKSDQLVMASTANQSLTFWGGFSSL